MFYRHLFIAQNVTRESYRAPSAMGGKPRIPVRNRANQSQKLLSQFDAIWQQKAQLQLQRQAEQMATREGTYIQFAGAAGYDLITKSLEDLGKGIRLLNVKEIPVDETRTQTRATVYIPNGKEGHFITKIQNYQNKETAKGQPKNAPLVDSIEDVSAVLLEGLWTDDPSRIPADAATWCEAWLNVNTKQNREQEQIEQFSATAQRIGIEVKPRSIVFPERAVLLVNANRAQLVELMLQSDVLAEFRAGQEPAGFWVNEPRVEQQAWAETVRGLVVHSANWHPAMLAQLNVQRGNRTSFRNLLRTFGFGIPDLNRALYSQESALTYIAQETIQPFAFRSGSRTTQTNEIHFFNFPWASDLLLQMGEIPVKLKVTLSYFIEPGAGEIGWKDKYRYQSHGLRFDVNKVNEPEIDFRKRINIAAREADEEVNTNADSNRWAIGPNNRSTGSIHSDFWEGTAADLSTCHYIAVFPVIGWWRTRNHLDKVENQARYSLIISLETPAEDIKLYTTVKNMIEIPVEVLAT